MIQNRLVTFHLENLIGSTNGLDPTNLKRGRVRTQRPVGIDASANGQVRYWSLTSLNISQMISDNHYRVYYEINLRISI